MTKILGISGFEDSVPFKKMHWPGLDEREYRISQGHDSAAVLIMDGEIVTGVAEERINRKKHSADFPISAIQFCLRQANLQIEEIDEIAHGFDYTPYKPLYSLDPLSAKQYREVFSRERLIEHVEKCFPGYPADRVRQVNHHLAHAASAFWTSGWDECLVLVIDGMSETQSATAYRACGNQLVKLREIPASDSIGILYSIVTLHLGFDFNSDEYKIMGLAPYGDPQRFRAFFEEAVKLKDDGTIQIPLLKLNKERADRETYGATRRYLSEHLIPPRNPETEITDDHRDVAAALQECLDKVLLHICGHFGSTTGLRRLALAGGVALNCTANGRLLQSAMFDEIYVQPAAGDDGSALGAGLWRASRTGNMKSTKFPVPFLGPQHSTHEIQSAVEQYRDRINVKPFETLRE